MRSRHCQRACKLVNADRPLDGLTVTRRSDVSDARPEGASQSQAVVYDQFPCRRQSLPITQCLAKVQGIKAQPKQAKTDSIIHSLSRLSRHGSMHGPNAEQHIC